VITRFVQTYPEMQLEIATEGRFVDIVAAGFDAGVRFGESVERDMVAVRISADLRMAVVGSPTISALIPSRASRTISPDHACIRFRLPGGSLYRWEFEKAGEAMEVEVGAADPGRSGADAGCGDRWRGAGHRLERHARPHLRAGRLKRSSPIGVRLFPDIFCIIQAAGRFPPACAPSST
jgi:LysR substrate binding domain.